ncbi:3-phosphoshikimate 1-carboxyvinyltransferase [Marispirochaeta sp.]|uniref:3-phosphoshikimate 1-carboxyvinyltransferase n=1 Tax=Marispirochaeta sp. TaxID=2038653 RepID=UPI0029C98F7C|nr:3-phosphoshikimate 1-carboxyvinyltransferase [Marispirochaeta sp.]
MIQTVFPVESLEGSITIPGSKSHTIRALLIASLAKGESLLSAPLDSSDTRSCVALCRALGAEITEEDSAWRIKGTGGSVKPAEDEIDVGNSGTSLYLGAGAAALGRRKIIFTGDEQIRSRPIQPLIDALRDLGAEAASVKKNGSAPVRIKGPLTGGKTSIECPTSQYLSSLLLALPLAEGDSEIQVPLLHEKPYVEMTLDWLDRQGIRYENDDFSRFRVFGGQSYTAFDSLIPGDFSTATFFLCAAAITGSTISLENLDMNDPQGDKEVAEILARMGCAVTIQEKAITISGKPMEGRVIDMNAIPDALPAMAVTACYAQGTTELINVPQARLKETDRISVMREELSRCGADIEERPDGLVIRNSPLKGGSIWSHRDHRIAMALAIGALGAKRPIAIRDAESVAVTVPQFFPLLRSLYT